MGVVYKAQDFKLERYVALKFLPQHLISEQTEKARFLQEAKAASALNHPNVCVIHDIQEKEDQQFIVMEYVDGVTLRKRLQDSSLKLNEAVSYAIQIGEALQEAHSQGIVHRDVKPENIMVNSKNQIKVMDFGLAKLKGSLKLTRTSSTVGTLAYMAPEQIQGGQVDARSDIFSFGIVLYEMLAGRTPFRGEHEAAMMYSIVNEEPEPALKYRPELSSEFLHVLNRVLEKDPNDRYQSVSDMVIELRRIKKDSDRVSRKWLAEMPVSSREQPSLEVSSTSKIAPISKKKIWIGLGAVATVVLAVVIVVLLSLPASRLKELNPNMTFRTLDIPFTQVGRPGMSADGNWISFAAADANGKWDIYFANTTGGEPRRITFDSTSWGGGINVSPDGNHIIYIFFNPQTRKSEARIVSSLGGASRTIAAPAQVGIWRPDGERIGYFSGQNWGGVNPNQLGKQEFRSVKPDGSDDQLEFIDSLGSIGWLAWSPDGKEVALERIFSPREQDIFVRELATGRERQLTFLKSDIAGLCWSTDGEIIFSSNKGGSFKIWMVPAAGGPAVQITKGVGDDFAPKISAHGGKLIYYQEQPVGQLWIAKLDGSGAQLVPVEPRFRSFPYLSPDGRQIAFAMIDPDNITVMHAYTINRNGTGRRQVSFGNESARVPRWSPDGKWIAYDSRANTEPLDSTKIYLVEAANPGKPKLIGRGMVRKWLDSERLVAFAYWQAKSWMTFADGRKQEQIYRDSTYAIPILKGKYILYQDLHADRTGWWIVPSDSSNDSQTTIPKKVAPSGLPTSFGPEDDFFLYVKNDGEIWKVHLPELREERIPGTFPGLTMASHFNASYDGKEAVYIDMRTTGKLVMIENLFK